MLLMPQLKPMIESFQFCLGLTRPYLYRVTHSGHKTNSLSLSIIPTLETQRSPSLQVLSDSGLSWEGAFALLYCVSGRKEYFEAWGNKRNVGTFLCYSLLPSPAALPLEAPWLSPLHSSFALSRLAPLASERNVAKEQERGSMLSAPVRVNNKWRHNPLCFPASTFTSSPSSSSQNNSEAFLYPRLCLFSLVYTQSLPWHLEITRAEWHWKCRKYVHMGVRVS